MLCQTHLCTAEEMTNEVSLLTSLPQPILSHHFIAQEAKKKKKKIININNENSC